MSEITEDITTWSEQRLMLWVKDSVERYEMADLTEQQAFSYTLATLMLILARAIAITDSSATEAGDRLVYAIDAIRSVRSERKRRES